jgi:hypothetical protein
MLKGVKCGNEAKRNGCDDSGLRCAVGLITVSLLLEFVFVSPKSSKTQDQDRETKNWKWRTFSPVRTCTVHFLQDLTYSFSVVNLNEDFYE